MILIFFVFSRCRLVAVVLFLLFNISENVSLNLAFDSCGIFMSLDNDYKCNSISPCLGIHHVALVLPWSGDRGMQWRPFVVLAETETPLRVQAPPGANSRGDL